MSRFRNPFRREAEPVEDSSAAVGELPESASTEPFMASQGLPARAEVGSLKAGASEVLMETVTLGSAEPAATQGWPVKWEVSALDSGSSSTTAGVEMPALKFHVPDGDSSSSPGAGGAQLVGSQEPEQAGGFFDGKLLTAEDLRDEQPAAASRWPSKIELGGLRADASEASEPIASYKLHDAWPKHYPEDDAPSALAGLAPGESDSVQAVEAGQAGDETFEEAEELLDL